MTEATSHVLRQSRELAPDQHNLPLLFTAEETIARMSDEDVMELQAQLNTSPTDGFLYLWLGLAARHRRQWKAAFDAFGHAIRHGCSHWRMGWYVAQTAREAGQAQIVEQACAAVLKANPDFWFARELPKYVRGRERVSSAVAAILDRPGCGVIREDGAGLTACPTEPSAGGATKVAAYIEQFFDHQAPRTRTKRELAPGLRGLVDFSDKPDWSAADAGGGAVDLLTVSDAGNALTLLRSADLKRGAPQVIAVAYGKQREAVLSFLARQHYSPLADEAGVLAVARFQARAAAVAGVPSTKNFTGLTGQPAYNEIETEFQGNLHSWLGRPADSVQRIVIVGACFGLEVKKFLQCYPRAEIHVFEPSQRHFPRLQAAYAHESRVHCHRFAVSDRCGTATFHEGSLQGTGSLLPVCDKSDPHAWVPFEAQEKFEVQLTTLDAFAPLRDAPIDLLWCDVQGAELQVLRGGRQALARCQSIFLEVATNKITYQNQCRFAELDRCAHEAGFYLAAIGLCPSGNGTGNAAWLRIPAAPISASSEPALSPAALRPVTGGERDALLARLHPHLLGLNYLPLDREIRTGVVDPLELLTPGRFDLAIKYLYALHRELGVQSSWARELYHAHIRAFSGGTCREGDGSKNSIEDYFRAFDRLLDDVKARGFDPATSLVPVARGNVLIDGAHRATACLLHRRPVAVLAFDRSDERFASTYFQKQGLDEKSADAAALQYCRLRPDSFVVTVFPSAIGREEEVRSILNREGCIVYAKTVTLNRRGARNLICEIYAGERWLGDARNNFAGADGKAEPCFRGDGPVRVYLLQAPDLDAVRRVKTAVRDLFGLANHSVHINDTHAQAVHLAQLFFNANSVHFLNHARLKHLERFARHLERYRKWLGADNRDPEKFCIDGSAVLAAYGLRDAQDLDVLHHGEADFRSVMPEVNSHNPDAHHHTTTRDDIIFNPDNHLYAFGLKFASIDVIRRMKAKRDEGKDRKDVALIDECCGAAPASAGLPANRPPKIIALIPARNEAARLPFCLRALRPYVDAVVYLDDCSDDDSVKVVESLAAECRVERIISKTVWHRDEPGDRNALLAAGRELGGTHFVVIDADEAFTANCAKDDYLRRLVLTLRPGETLTLSWIQLWRSLGQYRFDQSQWTYAAKAFAFCDDGHSSYQSGFIHTQRVPKGLTGRNIPVVNYVHGLLHFQFVNWPNLQIKQSWYRCMERIRQPRRSAAEINTQYAPSEDEAGLVLRDAPADWLEGYGGLDAGVFAARDERRVREVLAWFREHGVERFAELDIWRVDWAALCDDAALADKIRRVSGRTAVAPRITTLSAEVRRHMVAAGEHLARGDLAACRATVERAHAEAPGHPEILAALGNMHFVAKEFTDARKRFEASLALSPGQAKVWCQLAATQLRLKNASGFLAALQKALELDPESAAALRMLADHQAQRGQHRAAAGAYRKLAQLAPRDAALRVLLGQVLIAGGEHDEAAQVLRQALALDPALTAARRALDDLERKTRSHRPAAVAEACAR